MYRAAIHALVFCGCVGTNGGGLAHYVGQEKLAPMESWSSIALAKDWFGPSRLQNGPRWHYVHSRSVALRAELPRLPHGSREPAREENIVDEHTIDSNVRAVRNGWLPFYPQFDRNPLELVKEAEEQGQEVSSYLVDKTQEARAQVLHRAAGRRGDAGRASGSSGAATR